LIVEVTEDRELTEAADLARRQLIALATAIDSRQIRATRRPNDRGAQIAFRNPKGLIVIE
jgi:hypothetical protein